MKVNQIQKPTFPLVTANLLSTSGHYFPQECVPCQDKSLTKSLSLFNENDRASMISSTFTKLTFSECFVISYNIRMSHFLSHDLKFVDHCSHTLVTVSTGLTKSWIQ